MSAADLPPLRDDAVDDDKRVSLHVGLRHYTPEELVDPEGDFRLPTTARTLRDWAYQRRIPHNGMGKRITFTAADIRAMSALFAVPAVADQRRAS